VPAKRAYTKWPARNDVLGGLTLREPPPKDMPMPMVTRVTARRPS
jgi:periplasmic protein TonB